MVVDRTDSDQKLPCADLIIHPPLCFTDTYGTSHVPIYTRLSTLYPMGSAFVSILSVLKLYPEMGQS